MPDDSHASGTEVRALSSMAEYQDGAIVSKILLKKEKGSATLFAFDAGQELSEHTVPHDALVQVIDGEAEIAVDDVPHRLRAGDTLLMPGGHPHRVRAAERFKMVLTMIRA